MSRPGGDKERWADYRSVLLPDELADRGVVRDYLDLFADVAARLADLVEEDRHNPSALVMVHAQIVTASVWKAKRQSTDAKVVLERVLKESSYADSTRNETLDLQHRIGLQRMLMQHVGDAVESLKRLKADAKGAKEGKEPKLYDLNARKKGAH